MCYIMYNAGFDVETKVKEIGEGRAEKANAELGPIPAIPLHSFSPVPAVWLPTFWTCRHTVRRVPDALFLRPRCHRAHT